MMEVLAGGEIETVTEEDGDGDGRGVSADKSIGIQNFSEFSQNFSLNVLVLRSSFYHHIHFYYHHLIT